MSDDAEQYFNSWKSVFGAEQTTKLLCAWHVDRAWRNALKQHIATKEMRLEVYHNLRVLLMENQEADFRVLLQEFLSHLNSHEEDFYKYFKTNYCNCLEQWASCFRIGRVANTNLFLELFHRLLKIIYLQHKQIRRIDFLISVLLKIARDKIFEQLTKLEKGKYSHSVAEINKRHKSALNMLSLNVSATQKMKHAGSSHHKQTQLSCMPQMQAIVYQLQCMCTHVHLYLHGCNSASNCL